MALKKVSDEEVIAAMKRSGSTQMAAKQLGMSIRALASRKAKIQVEQGIALPAYAASQKLHQKTYIPEDRRVIEHTVENGMVFIGSDAHYWPGESTVAHKAFVNLIKEYKPKTVIMNGDVVDGARISRHCSTYCAPRYASDA